MRSAKGHIAKLGHNHYRIQVGCGRNPKTGKPQKLSKTIRGTLKDAELVRAKLLAQTGDTEEARESVTLSEFFYSYYLPNAEQRNRATTIEGYKSHYINEIEPTFGYTPLADIKPIQITFWLDTFDTDSKRFEAFKMLRILLNKAVRWDLLLSQILPTRRT